MATIVSNIRNNILDWESVALLSSSVITLGDEAISRERENVPCDERGEAKAETRGGGVPEHEDPPT